MWHVQGFGSQFTAEIQSDRTCVLVPSDSSCHSCRLFRIQDPGTSQPRVAASRPEEAERQSERDGFESALRRFPRTHIAASSQTS